MRRRLQTTLQKGPGGGDGSEVLLQSTSNQREGQFAPQTQSGSPGHSPPQGGGAASETSGGGAGSAEGSAGGSAALLAARRQGGSGGSEYSLDAHALGLGAGMVGIGGPMSAGHAGMHSGGLPARPLHPQQQQQQQYTFGDGPQQRLQQHQTFSGGHGGAAGGGGGGGSSSNMDADFTVDRRQSVGVGMGTWARAEQVGQSPYKTEAAHGMGIDRRHGPQSADVYGRRSYVPGELGSGMAPGMGSTAGFMESGGDGMMDLDTFVSGGEQSQAHVQMQQQQQQHTQGGLLAGGSRQHGLLGAPQQGMAGFSHQGRNDSPAGGFGPSGAGMDTFRGAPHAVGTGAGWGPSPDQVRALESPYDGGRGSGQYAIPGQQQQQVLQHQGSMPMPGSYSVQHQARVSQQGFGAPSDGGAAELLEQLHTSHGHRPHMVGAMEGPQYRGSGSGSGGYPGGMSVSMALDDMHMGAAGVQRGSNLGPSGMGSAPPVRGQSTTGLTGGTDFSSQRSRVVQYQQQQQQQQPQAPQHAFTPPLHGFMSRGQQQQTQHQPEDVSNAMQDRRAALIRQQLLSGPQSQSTGRGGVASQPQPELLAQQEQLAMLNTYGDNSFLGLTPSETAQLQVLAGGGAGQGLDRRGGRMGAGHSLADIAEYSGQDAGPNSTSSIAMDMSGAAGGVSASRMMTMHGPASAPPNITSYGSGAGAGGMAGSALHGSMPPQQPHGSMAPRGQQPQPHMIAQQHSGSVMDVLQQCAIGSGGAAQQPHSQAHQHQSQSILMRSSGPGSAGVRLGGDDGPGRYGGGGGGGRMDLMHHPAVEHGGGDMGGLGEGSRILSGLLPGAGGRDDALAARVCLKLFSCMPEDLPGDMLARLRRWAMAAESDAMQVFMRPGCVHVIVSIRHSGGQEAIERHVLGNGDLDAAVAALRGAFDSCGLLRSRRVVVQAAEGPRGAFEHDGVAGGAARWVSDADMARAPSVVSIMPPAIPCGTATVAVLAGRNLLRSGTRYYARCGGRSYELRPLVQQPHTVNNKIATTASGPQVAAADPAAAVRTFEAELRAHSTAVQPHAGGGHGAGGPTTPPMDSGDASVAPDSPMAGAAPSTSSSDSYASSARSTAARSEANTAEHPLSSSTSVDHGAAGGPATPTSAPAAAAVKGGSPLRRSRGDAAQADAPALEVAKRAVAAASAPAQAGRAAAAGDSVAAASDQLECVLVHVPALPKHGLMAVESVHAEVDVMGAWAPGVACQDPSTAVEVNAWVRRSSDPRSSRWLLLELGVLLDYDSVLPSLLEATSAASPAPAAAADALPDAHTGDLASDSAVRALVPAVQAAQPPRGMAVVPVASNPLPLGRGLDHLEMSTAASAAVAGAGALSAVPYQQQQHQHHLEVAAVEPVHESLLSPREDGVLELRLLPSSPAAPDQSLQQQAARDISQVPYTVISVAPTESQGDGGAAGNRGARNSIGTDDNASISDDTLKVPDAAARHAGTSYGRLLAHPLLHPNCRRNMLANASRLLVYSVASGLPLLASGLLEWLMGMEAPVMGLSAAAIAAATSQAQQPGAGAAACHTAGGHMAALSALFGRVLARAAAATERAMAAAILSVPGTNSTSGCTEGGEGENQYPAALDSTAIVLGLAPPPSPGLLASGYEPLPLTPPISGQSFSSSSFTLESRLQSFTDGMQRSVGGRGGSGLGLGLGLLHLAVASGSSGMVLAALDWADMFGRPWSLDELAGPRRTSPLHLAAALADGGEIARLLLSLPSTAHHGGQWADAWLLLRDGLGRTPAGIAAANSDPGLTAVNHFCVYGEEKDAGEAEADQAGENSEEGATVVTTSGQRRSDATSGLKEPTHGILRNGLAVALSATTEAHLPQQQQQQQLGHVGSPQLLVGGVVLVLALALMMLSSGMWRHE
ncbi:hypothetical protein HYH02_013766 [Chlamydomonas schloesseri]|uniref:Uncharacterized protein n=1 Tax=Chlamydomonas schloesseri TaxID=2026947 RepID=A0A835VY88_9CHLO|nr:hypothetical protein HYH02_013766 [Chlamydomonas schloesseri]|eukprot:KAG2430288.1 hypothetical protein HYH02_013766 [Chlamydomonas schloesseri]